MVVDLLAKLTRKYRTVLLLIGMGLFAGALGGLLGIGGGALIVPVLIFFIGFDQRKAHGTSLIAALLLSLVGAAVYYSRGRMEWTLAAEIAGGGIIGAAVGTRISHAIKARDYRRLLALFVAIMGILMLIAGLRHNHVESTLAAQSFINSGLSGGLMIVGVGALAGMVSAVMGVGAGLVVVPAMVIALGMPQKLAQGISLASILPTATLGLIMHGAMKNVDLRVGKWVGFGAAIGALIGSFLAMHIGAYILSISFGGYLLITAGLMAIKKSSIPQH